MAQPQPTPSRLNTLHNLRYYQTWMAKIRDAIEAGTLADFAKIHLSSHS